MIILEEGLQINAIITQERSLEGLLSLQVSEAGDELSSGALCDSLEVDLLAASDGQGSGLDEVLEAEVVDSTGSQDDVCAGVQDLHDALFRDVRLAVADLLELLGIGYENLFKINQTEV
jgi:hypothetical protein